MTIGQLSRLPGPIRTCALLFLLPVLSSCSFPPSAPSATSSTTQAVPAPRLPTAASPTFAAVPSAEELNPTWVEIPLGPPPGDIVFHHEDDTVLLTSDGSLQALYTPGTLGPPVFASISPNCSLLALTIPIATQLGYQADIRIFSPESADEYDFQATAHYEDQPTWSPDGNALAYRLDAAAVQVAYLAGSPPTQLHESSRAIFSLAWSPAGDWIAFTEGPSTSRTLQLVSPVSKEIRMISTGGAIPSPSAIAWSPDGSKIAFSGEDCHLYVADLQANDVQSVVTTFGCIEDVTWSSDGSSIVFSSTRGTDEQTRFLHDLYSVSIDGSNLQRLTVSGKDRAPQTCRGA